MYISLGIISGGKCLSPVDYFASLCNTRITGAVEERPELRTVMEHIIVPIYLEKWLKIGAQIALIIFKRKILL